MKKLILSSLIALLIVLPFGAYAQIAPAQTTYSPQYIALLQQLLTLLEQELVAVEVEQTATSGEVAASPEVTQVQIAPAQNQEIENRAQTIVSTPTSTTALYYPPSSDGIPTVGTTTLPQNGHLGGICFVPGYNGSLYGTWAVNPGATPSDIECYMSISDYNDSHTGQETDIYGDQ